MYAIRSYYDVRSPRRIAARPIQAGDDSASYRIRDIAENDRYLACRLSRRNRRRRAHRHDQFDVIAQEVASQFGQPPNIPARPAVFEPEVGSLHPA